MEEGRAAPEHGYGCPPTPHIYIGARERGAGPLRSNLRRGRRPGGLPCPPRQGGRLPLGFPQTLRRMGLGGEGAQPTKGLVPLHIQPIGPSGAGGPSRWTPGTPPMVPVQYR